MLYTFKTGEYAGTQVDLQGLLAHRQNEQQHDLRRYDRFHRILRSRTSNLCGYFHNTSDDERQERAELSDRYISSHRSAHFDLILKKLVYYISRPITPDTSSETSLSDSQDPVDKFLEDYAIKQIEYYQGIIKRLGPQLDKSKKDSPLLGKFKTEYFNALSEIKYYQENFHSDFDTFLIETDDALKTTPFRMRL